MNDKIFRIKTTWNFLNCCRHSNPYWILINPPLPAKQTQQLQCVSRGVSRRTTATCYRTDPVSSAEVHRLSEVVALVKPRVIGPRERHNKLASTLIGPVHLNAKSETGYEGKRKQQKRETFHQSVSEVFFKLDNDKLLSYTYQKITSGLKKLSVSPSYNIMSLIN